MMSYNSSETVIEALKACHYVEIDKITDSESAQECRPEPVTTNQNIALQMLRNKHVSETRTTKYPLFRMKCIQSILLVQCKPPAFNKKIKWGYHQQVAKKLLAVAAVIYEAIHLSRDEAGHHPNG